MELAAAFAHSIYVSPPGIHIVVFQQAIMHCHSVVIYPFVWWLRYGLVDANGCAMSDRCNRVRFHDPFEAFYRDW